MIFLSVSCLFLSVSFSCDILSACVYIILCRLLHVLCRWLALVNQFHLLYIRTAFGFHVPLLSAFYCCYLVSMCLLSYLPEITEQ